MPPAEAKAAIGATLLRAVLPRPSLLLSEPGAADSVDQVRSIVLQTPVSLFGNLVGVLFLGGMFVTIAPARAWGWMFALLALTALRGWHALRYPRRAPLPLLLRWRRQWSSLTLASAVGWGIGAWLFYGLGDTFHTVGVIMIVYAYCVGAVQLLARQSRLFMAFITVCLVPVIVRISIDTREPYRLQLAAILVLLFLMITLMAQRFREAFERTVVLKLQGERLLAQLQQEKAAADAARHEAEVANRAKTQFFAAASHDLRQPLHALGLFAEALRARSAEDEQATHMVNSINASVDALEGLFSELLDITKIDAGGIKPQPRDFALSDLWRRLQLHFEPLAFEKGLELRLHGARHHAHADPLLVERVLRNLVSNAIRYTREGGVLVGARRRGEQLLLQVFDTGVGIGERERERIFEEFYQVSDEARAADPQQRKGLGLGLAIVKRLAGLMEAPLTLRSRPGRGSVFTLAVPLGRAPLPPVPGAAGAAPAGMTLGGRTIVVVEDDLAVRGGVEVLLRGWGAHVESFDSMRALAAWVRSLPADAVVPDLVIADYRLEGERNGAEAIEVLRERFGPQLPAVMVTGSIMSGHEALAQAQNFHLLLKPVVPHKLRAMIAFKLGSRKA